MKFAPTWKIVGAILAITILSFGVGLDLGADIVRSIAPWEAEIPSIEVLGLAWDLAVDPIINVKITPNTSLALWRQSFIDDAYSSIMRWEECISTFTSRYGFERLSKLKFETYIVGLNASDATQYQVILRWIDVFEDQNTLAETILVSDSFGRLNSAIITLALSGVVKGRYRTLDDGEMRAVVAEEFGHALGLGHANLSHDLMGGFGTLVENDVCHSTLDVYALAVVYAYLDYGSFRAGQRGRVSLDGTGIPYLHLADGAT